MKTELFISVRDGKIVNRQAVANLFPSLADGRYLITVESKNSRSLDQNNWFHAILPEILEGLRNVGYMEVKTTKDAKNFLKSMFFRKKISNGNDEFEIVQDTSDTSKEDFTQRAEEIIIWAADYLGIDVAPPGKQTSMNYQ
jgi:hypothetical protein